MHRLATHTDDCYVLSTPPGDAGLVSHALLSTFLEVYAPVDHPLTRRGQVRFEDVAREPFLMREPGSGTRMLVDGLFDKYGATPTIRMELGQQ